MVVRVMGERGIMSDRHLEARIRSIGRATGVEPSNPTAALVAGVLRSPIEVRNRPPTYSREISWLDRAMDLLSSMPPCLQVTLTANPEALESVLDVVINQLALLDWQNQATQLSGQHVALFGLPKLQPEQTEVFSQVVTVADQLGATHEKLITSDKREARKAQESLNLMQSLVFWLYEKAIALLTDLLAEEAQLRKTQIDLQVASRYQTVNYNHHTVAPQIQPQLDLVTQQVGQLEKYLGYLRNVGHALSLAMQLPENALGQVMAAPSILGGRTN